MMDQKWYYDWLVAAWRWLLKNKDSPYDSHEVADSYTKLWVKAKEEKNPFARNIMRTMAAALGWEKGISGKAKLARQAQAEATALSKMAGELETELKEMTKDELGSMQGQINTMYYFANSMVGMLKDETKRRTR
jgi:hypothetical protein